MDAPCLPRIKQTDFFRLNEDKLISALANSLSVSKVSQSIELSKSHAAIATWSQMAADVPNGGFVQFFWNHRGHDGVSELAEIMVSLGEDKLASSIHGALKVYQQHTALFATEKPWDELFGRIKEFEHLDKSFELRQLKGTRALERWIRTHIHELATDEHGKPINPELTGSVESKHSNGLTAEYLEVKKGKPHGSYREFFEDGSVRRVQFYKNGKVSGDYWPNGQMKRKELKKGVLTIIEWYFPSGKIHKRYVKDKSGYAVEPIRLFHENGQLAEELREKNGKKVGLWQKFFEDGSPKLQAEFGNDEVLIVHNAWDGEHRQIVKDGTGTYEEDLVTIDWPYDVFHENGWPMVLELKNGVPHGKVVTYWQGVIWRIDEYQHSIRDGTSTLYWDNGRVRQIEQYKAGELQAGVQSYPKFEKPVPAVLLHIEANEQLYSAWGHILVDEYPRVENLDDIQQKLKIPPFLRDVHERNLAGILKDPYEDANTFSDAIAYGLQLNEAGVVIAVKARSSGIYSGKDWETYTDLLKQLHFSPGRIRGRAMACKVLARVVHTFIEGKLPKT